MIGEIERFIRLDMRAMRLANMTLRENFALSAPWRYTLWLGGMVVRHFNSLDEVETYLAEIARSAEAGR